MKRIASEDIELMNKHYRVQFVNSLTGYKSANLIGTQSLKDDSANLAIFSSCVHVGSQPPLLSLLFRPDLVPRNTLENILETDVFTLNHVTQEIYRKAHQTSAKYPKGISEFIEVGLTEDFKDGFIAPFVKESPLQIGLRKIEDHLIKANGTLLIVASVECVYINENFILEDGSLDLEKTNTVALAGLDTYFKTEKLEKMPYAHKPKSGVSF